MTSRSGLFLGVAAFLLGACGRPDGLELIPAATKSCEGEAPTSDQTSPNALMLPGRVCGACHRAGGQAANSPWTMAGTVYGAASGSCNTGGLANITVEVSYAMDDPKGQYHVDDLQPGGQLKTNSAGNFYTTARFVAPMKIRIYEGPANAPTRQAAMAKLVGTDPSGAQIAVDCNSCHYPNSPDLPGGSFGRVFLE